MTINIIRNKFDKNRFDVEGIQGTKKGFAGFHGRCASIIGWIAAYIFRKAVPIPTKQGVFYINCKSLEKWRQIAAPDSPSINMRDSKVVQAMIKGIKAGADQPVSNDPSPQISNPISLNFTFEEGVVLTSLSTEEKNAFSSMLEAWQNRNSPEKDWSISELAALVNQEEAVLQKLFDLLFLIPNEHNVKALFKALESGLSTEMRVSFQPSAKNLWKGANEQLFGKGSDREVWELDDLSRFLAVSKEALVAFLGDRKDQYTYGEIHGALMDAENSKLNGILEKNRIQRASIRWMLA